MNSYLQSLPELMKAAAHNPLGITALAITLPAIVACVLLRKAAERWRLIAFAGVFVGCMGFASVALIEQRADDSARLKSALTIPDLRLGLVFRGNDLVNPMHADVHAWVQRKNDTVETPLTENVQYIKGVGGLSVNFSQLSVGDRVWVVVGDHGHLWRSDDMRILEAQLVMNPEQP